MYRKISLVLLLLAVVALAGVPQVLATPTIKNNFTTLYGVAGTRIDSCDTCHIPGQAPGFSTLNPYGKDLFNDSSYATNVTRSMINVEPKDSDNDGFTNIEEIHNLTFPGNTSDFPPQITSFAPPSPITSTETPATITFNVTINQVVDNATWALDGTVTKTEHNVNASNGTLTTSIIGTHTVTFTAQRTGDGSAMQNWTWNVTNVTVPPTLKSIEVSPSTATLNVSETQVFTATALDQNNTPMAGINISWAVSNSTVGNLSPLNSITDINGSATTTFTAAAVGNAMINATNGSVTGNASVTVITAPVIVPVLTTIVVSPSTATLNVSETQVFTATALDQNKTPMQGINISWTSSNTTAGIVNPPNATTDMNGTATTTFTALAPGTAMVNATSDNVTGTSTVTVTLPIVTNGSISGVKFNDSDGNGIRESNETGLANWTIVLNDSTGATVATTLTASDGSYNFSNLSAGNYTVGEILEPGWRQTAPPTGTYSVNITAAGENITGEDFGNMQIVPTFIISGFKLNDATGEGIPGWNITLTNNTMQTTTTTTDMNGFYEFIGLANGTYNVSEEMKPGFTPIGDTFRIVTIENMDVMNVNFTNQPIMPTFSISGFKINGTNNNGMGLENWNILLLNPDTGAEIANATTDSMGFYKFPNLTNGTYNVTERMMTGWTNISATSQIINISGADVMNVNFTNALIPPPTFSISGFKINGTDNNGMGLENWNILLNNDTGAQIASTMTDSKGFYNFTGLTNGTYNVTEVMKAGWMNASNSPTSQNVTINGADVTNVNFTNVLVPSQATFTISGFKINGATGEGIQGWLISAENATTGTPIFNTTTDATGFYLIPNLTNGNYIVIEETRAGFTPSGPTSQNVTINNADVTNINFTNTPAFGSISGTKFNDSNGNGTRDMGEEGLPDWTIILTMPDGSTQSTVTNADGTYMFSNLSAGNYTVGEVLKSGWNQTAPTPPGTYSVNLAPGQDVTGKDFGNMLVVLPPPPTVNGSISGFKINAANGMGLRGWTIRLIGIVGKGAETRVIRMDTTTSADGSYMFNNLPAGRYILREELQRGFVPVGSPVKNIILEPGENSMNNNFTNRPIRSLVGIENDKGTENNRHTENDRDTE